MKSYGKRYQKGRHLASLWLAQVQNKSSKKKFRQKANPSILIATCSTGKMVDRDKRKSECKEIGLHFSHVYSLIDSFLITKQEFGTNRDYRLLKIKNPRISNWKGLWCKAKSREEGENDLQNENAKEVDFYDDSDIWTDKIKDYVGFDPTDRWTFYITFEDYWTYFYKLTLWFYDPKIQFKYINLSHPPGSANLIRFQIYKESKIHFKVVQMCRCLLPRSFRYKVSRVHLIIAKIDKSVNYICGFEANSAENFWIKPDNAFKPGEYWIRIEVDWNHDNLNEYCVNFLTQNEIDIYEDFETDHFTFLKQCMMSYAK